MTGQSTSTATESLLILAREVAQHLEKQAGRPGAANVVKALCDEVERLQQPVVPAQTTPTSSEVFCDWLRVYFLGLAGKDELTAAEANRIRNKLNGLVYIPTPASTHMPDPDAANERRAQEDERLANNVRERTFEDAARICESWIGTFQQFEIKHTSARTYAIGAVEDIAEMLRDKEDRETTLASIGSSFPSTDRIPAASEDRSNG